jgi:hypothetical protein
VVAWFTRIPPLIARRQLEQIALADGRREDRLELVSETRDHEIHRLRLELRDLDIQVLLEREGDRFLEAQLAKITGRRSWLDGAGARRFLDVVEALLIRAHGLLDDGVLTRASLATGCCAKAVAPSEMTIAIANEVTRFMIFFFLRCA